MSSKTARKVVQTVFRGARPASVAKPATVPTTLKAKAKAIAKATPRPRSHPKKSRPKTVLGNKRIKPQGVKPAVYKKDANKPLTERLNDVLMAQLRERKVTNAQAAEALGISETYLSRTVAAIQEKSPGQTSEQREARQKLYKARIQTRNMLAKKVNKGEITLTKAAEQANCSERTMFRYCAKFA